MPDTFGSTTESLMSVRKTWRSFGPATTIALLLCLATSGWTSTHYIAANGSDSNSGTSTSAPWLHAPGMPACSNNCAAYNPAAGDQFIFRGGDTWHFGNSAAAPFVGSGGWSWNWSGTVGDPIYIGVSSTWYSGSSWTRPILTGDNAITSSPVSSCKYDESTLTMVNLNGADVTFDNFEMLGGCWHGNQNNSGTNICCFAFIGKAELPNPVNIIISNVYIHGWSHVTFNCSGGSSGTCDGAQGITGDSHQNGGQGNQLVGVVIDGSDSATSLSANLWDCYDIHNSVFRYATQGTVCNNMHTFHDNLIEYISESPDSYSHSNGFEFNSEWAGTNTIYNNVMRHITAAVAGWVCPTSVDYHFNNVVYDTIGQGWDVDPTGGATAMYFYNNTIQGGGVGSNGSWQGILANNIFIDGGSPLGSPISNNNSIVWTSTQASAAGYSSSSTYPYQPTSANCNGKTPCPVGSGTNLTSACTAAGSAFCSDTTTGCSYRVSTHSVTCPARLPIPEPPSGSWNVGAFRWGPGAPTTLTGTVVNP